MLFPVNPAFPKLSQKPKFFPKNVNSFLFCFGEFHLSSSQSHILSLFQAFYHFPKSTISKIYYVTGHTSLSSKGQISLSSSIIHLPFPCNTPSPLLAPYFVMYLSPILPSIRPVIAPKYSVSAYLGACYVTRSRRKKDPGVFAPRSMFSIMFRLAIFAPKRVTTIAPKHSNKSYLLTKFYSF